MKMSLLKTILGVLALGLGVLTASAQTAPTVDRPALDKLGPALKQMIETHRASTKALLEQRKATIERFRAASPAEQETIKAELRAIMKNHQQDQRELARQIRDAIKARRDAQRKTGG